MKNGNNSKGISKMPLEEYLKMLECLAIVVGGVVIITIPSALLLTLFDDKITKTIEKIRRIFNGKRKKK